MPQDKSTTAVAAEETEPLENEEHPSDFDPGDEELVEREEDKGEKAEEPEEAEEQSSESEGKFDDEIIAIASDFGVSEAEARSYSSVADLERALTAIDSAAPESAAAVPTTGTTADTDEAKAKAVAELERIVIEAGDDLDEGLVKQINDAFGKITDRYDQRNKEFQESVAGIQANMQAQQASQFVARFDDMLSRHGGDYEYEVGKGATADVSGKHRGARDKIVDEMGVIVASHQMRNRPIPSDDELMKRALREVLGDAKEKNGKVVSRQRQFLRRGSSRSTQNPSKRMRARLDLREKLDALSGGEDES